MSKLFLFGDSFTAGNGCLPDEEYTVNYKKNSNDLIWGELLAKGLDLSLTNYGMGLFSNDKMPYNIFPDRFNIRRLLTSY